MSHSGGLTISAETRVLAVLGHPIAHSLSPVMHNAALQAQGVDAVYLAFDVEPGDLPSALRGLRALGFWGANVTLPHKERAAELVDTLDPLAARLGAVNTIVNANGLLSGHNTDVTGFTQALEMVRSEGAAGARCLVVGAGGAARAVLAALDAGGAADIRLYSRTAARAESLCQMTREWEGTFCEAIEASGLARAAAEADIIVNATPVGLGLSVKESAIPVDILDSHHVVVDLVYGLQPTFLVTEAIARGAVAVDGMEMLLSQAASSYRLWTGKEAPLDVMRASVGQVGR
jgi:shikimate dehydrogenase